MLFLRIGLVPNAGLVARKKRRGAERIGGAGLPYCKSRHKSEKGPKRPFSYYLISTNYMAAALAVISIIAVMSTVISVMLISAIATSIPAIVLLLTPTSADCLCNDS